MIIGLDFDNTIVSYNQAFHSIAVEWKVVPENLPRNKVAVRNFLRASNQEDCWTEMQGYVYGACMDQAQLFPGFIACLEQLCQFGHTALIISHKTAYPFLGPKYDLHFAARNWIKKNLGSFFDDHRVFFEPTKEEKIKRIEELKCDIFIDDLPEILRSTQFPKNTLRILFDPDHTYHGDILKFSSWSKLCLFQKN